METEEQIQAFRRTYTALRSEIGQVIVGHGTDCRRHLDRFVCRRACAVGRRARLGKNLAGARAQPGAGPLLQPHPIHSRPDLKRIFWARTWSWKLPVAAGSSSISAAIFAHLILADEINRATPKTQSALLEAMQEHSVTAGGEIRKLAEPFFVFATQNPIDQEGTYPLPPAGNWTVFSSSCSSPIRAARS